MRQNIKRTQKGSGIIRSLSASSGGSYRAFTLIELLATIVIIVILAALVFPVQKKLLHSARQSKCVSNLQQIATAVRLYMADNDGFPPVNSQDPVKAGLGWSGYWFKPNEMANIADPGLANYAGGRQTLAKLTVCPENLYNSSDRQAPANPAHLLGYAYSANYNVMIAAGALAAKKNPAISRSSEIVLMGDSTVTSTAARTTWGAGFNDLPQANLFLDNRHGNQLNILWVDGHVTATKKSDLLARNILPTLP